MLLVALATVVAACGSSSSASNTPTPTTPAASGSAAATSNVSIQNLAFTPKTLTVSPGHDSDLDEQRLDAAQRHLDREHLA